MNTFNRPEITNEKIEIIRKLIEENPDMGRTKLSILLCEMWGWRGANGQLKDMSCRDILRALDKAGKIVLPEPKLISSKAGKHRKIKHLAHDETPIESSLKDLHPLRVEVVSSKAELEQFKSYIDQYHYLGFDRFIGERMAYMVKSRDGVMLSCLLFGSAAWSCADRDKYTDFCYNACRVNRTYAFDRSQCIGHQRHVFFNSLIVKFQLFFMGPDCPIRESKNLVNRIIDCLWQPVRTPCSLLYSLSNFFRVLKVTFGFVVNEGS